MSSNEEVVLPDSVEQTIARICQEKNQPPLRNYARKMLAEIGEEASVKLLMKILASSSIKSFSGFVRHMVKKDYPDQAANVLSPSDSSAFTPLKTQRMWSPSSDSNFSSPQGQSGEAQKKWSPSHSSQFNSPQAQSGEAQKMWLPSSSYQFNSPHPQSGEAQTRWSSSSGSTFNSQHAQSTVRFDHSGGEAQKMWSPSSNSPFNSSHPVTLLGDAAQKMWSPSSSSPFNSSHPQNGEAQKMCSPSPSSQFNSPHPQSGEAQKMWSASSHSPFNTPHPQSGEAQNTWSPSSHSHINSPHAQNGESLQSPSSSSSRNSASSNFKRSALQNVNRHLSFEDTGPSGSNQASNGGEVRTTVSQQLMILTTLEYRKLFLVLSYIGRKKLETVIDVNSANEISGMKDLPMVNFEERIWNNYGRRFCDVSDRTVSADWNSWKTHLYYCHADRDGSYYFKGPYLNSTRTHLQRTLGDDNVLIVKFLEDGTYCKDNIVANGILVGVRRFRFFVFKDDRKRAKSNQIEEEKATSSVKCYFVRTDSLASCGEAENYILSGKTITEARRLFMHINTVSTMEKYMARFSLILSKTIRLQLDFGAVTVEKIEDIPFQDENGSFICGEDGKPLMHTDGTGYISEDLAITCPKDFCSAKYTNDNNFEKVDDLLDSEGAACQRTGVEARKEPPLLMQCRLFYQGCAVKGTLLVNKKLAKGTIQIRPSMVKVERDPTLPVEETINSLEIVSVSHKPGRTFLSKNLIALLSYGRVPHEFFLDLLKTCLEEARNVYSDRRAALRVTLNNDGLDTGSVVLRMILCGIPLNEPFLQHCLSGMEKGERSQLRNGKIPIADSFYLMGTADPTGILNNNQVCVILDNGQISGTVLVYRNPGIHFGDIHVLEAVYVKGLEEIVGNAKYGIFFSTKGRSAAYEMASGDFDGDMYLVSRNPELLKHYKASEPWSRVHSTPNSIKRGPQDYSSMELEYELFQLFLRARTPSFDMATASNSWRSFMDRLLTLGDGCTSEKECLREKMIHLIDIYYDALDAPKSGKKVDVLKELKPEKYPHHMGMVHNTYKSCSILGKIYDKVEEFKSEPVTKIEIWKLPTFDVQIPEAYINLWKSRYDDYRRDMSQALKSGGESKKEAASEVIKKYKQLLYDATEMEESHKNSEVIYEEAIAIYRVIYDHATIHGVEKCGFAWKVAGSALCNFFAWKLAGLKEKDKPIVVLPSVLRVVLY